MDAWVQVVVCNPGLLQGYFVYLYLELHWYLYFGFPLVPIVCLGAGGMQARPGAARPSSPRPNHPRAEVGGWAVEGRRAGGVCVCWICVKKRGTMSTF